MANDFPFDVGQSSHSNSELYVTDFTPPALRDDYFAEQGGGEEPSLLDTMSNNVSKAADSLMAVAKTGSMMTDVLYTGLLGNSLGEEVNEFRHGTSDAIEKGVEGTVQLLESTVRTSYDLSPVSIAINLKETPENEVVLDVEKNHLAPDLVRGLRSLKNGADTLNAIKQDPTIIVESMIDPIKKNWNNGHKSYAVGLTIGEIFSNVFGGKGAGKAGAVEKAAGVANATEKKLAKSVDEIPDQPLEFSAWVKEASPEELRDVLSSSANMDKVRNVFNGENGFKATTSMSPTTSDKFLNAIDDLRGNEITPDKIPTNKRKPVVPNFEEFMDDLTHHEYEKLIENPANKAVVASRLRGDGKLHEALSVNSFIKNRNRLDLNVAEVTSSQIPIKDVKLVNPHTGEKGHHGGKGSGIYHTEIEKVIDGANNKNELNKSLKKLADEWEAPYKDIDFK